MQPAKGRGSGLKEHKTSNDNVPVNKQRMMPYYLLNYVTWTY